MSAIRFAPNDKQTEKEASESPFSIRSLSCARNMEDSESASDSRQFGGLAMRRHNCKATTTRIPPSKSSAIAPPRFPLIGHRSLSLSLQLAS